eukprot:CAMPEP_0170740558 /NCGR_PEP_ID=MMETSP0437-20130122/5748_1 /TAXON_ID=0 /ORGANISM="Sexangularia sp." /LENGTH=47 /DNA_ID= /DNA_START= /DNA_END= /DNA_ORIENTATION=
MVAAAVTAVRHRCVRSARDTRRWSAVPRARRTAACGVALAGRLDPIY